MNFNKIKYLLFIIVLTVSGQTMAQKAKTDAMLFGDVKSMPDMKHIPYATIMVKGTTIGTTADETGHFKLINLPVGKNIIVATAVGYKPQEKEVSTDKDKAVNLFFELNEDVLNLDQIVVTGDRNEKNRRETSVIVNTLNSKLFNVANTVTLSEGLNFCPGLRMENDCQNCGFSQVRMNGMEGPYSQILINGRAIFSGLAGVYGLEMIPANIIERVEVVRGGGSALYGSNAIAGTINLILKDPIRNTYEIGLNSGFSGVGIEGSGGATPDYSVNANASIISDDNKTGMSIYGFYRSRDPFDANGDDFSELAKLNNTTFGSRFFHRFGYRGKLSGDFFNIKEERRGGDRFDYPKHEANIAEAVDHNITTGALTYEQFFRDRDQWSTYVSGQQVLRDSYYGAEQSLQDYGKTTGMTYVVGSQYNAKIGESNLIAGIEGRFESLNDQKLGYPDIENAVIEDNTIVKVPHTENTLVAHQTSNTTGAFAQYDIDLNKLCITVGGRFDHYQITDEADVTKKSGNVFSPRVTLKHDLLEYLQARVSYSQGYRAPQIFDEDLHIETSGSRRVLHENDPGLKQETSHSYMASVDFNKQIGSTYWGFLAEAFYTRLNNAFVNEYGKADEEGTVTYTRTNAEGGATVQGINLEMNVVPSQKFSFKSGFTLQKSGYEEAQEFNEKRFFRTPDNYGYLTLDWQPVHNLGISSTANSTGKMMVPYFGNQLQNPDEGELHTSEPFFDWGFKVRYNIKLNGASLQIFGGMKNILNSYQHDFDSGIDRDPGYIYGPSLPRSVYLGIKIGNLMN